MSYQVHITAQANADLRGIYEYIAFTLLAPENAARQLARLEKSILSLDEMPKRFKKYEYEPWKTRGLRIMPVGHFVVLYIPNEEANIVNIIRVMYGGRNIDEQLNEHTKF
jgi:plasmid stabilization system protein ParE